MPVTKMSINECLQCVGKILKADSMWLKFLNNFKTGYKFTASYFIHTFLPLFDDDELEFNDA